ncbi:hypothetical protein VYU27_008494 [Nannochloropsis oceanica]
MQRQYLQKGSKGVTCKTLPSLHQNWKLGTSSSYPYRDLLFHVHQLRQSYAATGACRLPLFDVQSGFMCACHVSPRALRREYIYKTKKSFHHNHAKCCPSRAENSTHTTVPISCFFQALCSNKAIAPSNVFARPGPVTTQHLNASVTEQDRRLARQITRTVNGDLRPRHAAEGRG